jgi:hypothetical protein
LSCRRKAPPGRQPRQSEFTNAKARGKCQQDRASKDHGKSAIHRKKASPEIASARNAGRAIMAL